MGKVDVGVEVEVRPRLTVVELLKLYDFVKVRMRHRYDTSWLQVMLASGMATPTMALSAWREKAPVAFVAFYPTQNPFVVRKGSARRPDPDYSGEFIYIEHFESDGLGLSAIRDFFGSVFELFPNSRFLIWYSFQKRDRRKAYRQHMLRRKEVRDEFRNETNEGRGHNGSGVPRVLSELRGSSSGSAGKTEHGGDSGYAGLGSVDGGCPGSWSHTLEQLGLLGSEAGAVSPEGVRSPVPGAPAAVGGAGDLGGPVGERPEGLRAPRGESGGGDPGGPRRRQPAKQHRVEHPGEVESGSGVEGDH